MIRVVTERPDGTRRVAMKCEGPSLTEQAHKKDVDIKRIMARAKSTGFARQVFKPAMYGDFSGVEDFHSVQNKVLQAKADFMRLPGAVRKRFENDPGELIEFVADPENAAEAVELGLLSREAAEAPLGAPEEPEAPEGGSEEPDPAA